MMYYIAAIVVVFDQLTKLWAVRALGPDQHQKTITIVENFVQLCYATNQGGAAGLLGEHPQLLTLLSLGALGVILWWAHTVPAEEWIARIGFGLILGGAVGNLLDRLFRGGFVFGTYVVDFVDVHWYYRIHWPTFNLADTCICTGIAVVLLGHLLTKPQSSLVAPAPNGPGPKPAADSVSRQASR